MLVRVPFEHVGEVRSGKVVGQDCGDMILAVTETECTAYAAKHNPRVPNSQECTLQTLLVAGMLDAV